MGQAAASQRGRKLPLSTSLAYLALRSSVACCATRHAGLEWGLDANPPTKHPQAPAHPPTPRPQPPTPTHLLQRDDGGAVEEEGGTNAPDGGLQEEGRVQPEQQERVGRREGHMGVGTGWPSELPRITA